MRESLEQEYAVDVEAVLVHDIVCFVRGQHLTRAQVQSLLDRVRMLAADPER